CSFVFRALSLPRCPTLLPYTTLFRSTRATWNGTCDVARPLAVGLVQMSMAEAPEENLVRAIAHVRAAAAEGARLICLPELFRSRDRKSTRLNSIHVKISYAVFCLNKK